MKLSKCPKCYICGKITDLPEEEFKQNFFAAKMHVIEMGYEPVNPCELPHDHDKTWLSYMRECIAALAYCDAIYIQDNWIESKGARLEITIAIDLGLKKILQ